MTTKRNALEEFRLLAEAIPIGAALIDSQLGLLYTNPAFERIFGCSSRDLSTVPVWLERSSLDENSRRSLLDALRGLSANAAGCQGVALQVTAGCADGARRDLALKVIERPDGEFMVLCEDVSELTHARMDREESEDKYRDLLEHLTDFVCTLDCQGKLLTVNSAALNAFGYKPEEVLGNSIEKFISPTLRNTILDNLTKVAQEGSTAGMSQYVTKDGTTRHVEYRAAIIGTDRSTPRIVAVARDVTDRIRMKKALKESEVRFQLLVESAHDGILYIDPDGTIQFANLRMREILRDRQPEGKNLKDYYDEQNREILEEKLRVRRTGESTTYFITLTDLEGFRHEMVVSGTPDFDHENNYLGAMGIFTDISELRKLEAQLQQSQKMEAIGTLAGGIAHDFNNILSGILGYASLLKKHAASDSRLAHYADMIGKSAERGAALAGQLLTFSRKGPRFVKNVDVHKLINDVLEILHHTLDRSILIVTRMDAESSVVKGDPGQIQQVIMNLCINAKDAMPKGGRLLVATDAIEVHEQYCRSREGLHPGPYLKITVEDSGEGMPEHVRRRVFEPFFTTKEEGKGTGLGLSMVYSAVKSHAGYVEVYSEPGSGTSFKMLFPLNRVVGIDQEPTRLDNVTVGTGTVLVVDDEEIIRTVLADMLREMGFRVLTAEDGQEGVEIYRESWRDIDAVIMDLIMPRLGGKGAFRAMREINPSVRVILSTGFSRDRTIEEALSEGVVAFVQKPFRIEELSDAIYQALDPSLDKC
jgi:PAS domain S-box-containing protein